MVECLGGFQIIQLSIYATNTTHADNISRLTIALRKYTTSHGAVTDKSRAIVKSRVESYTNSFPMIAESETSGFAGLTNGGADSAGRGPAFLSHGLASQIY